MNKFLLALFLFAVVFNHTLSAQSIAGSRHSSLAVCSDRTVMSWGYNGYGQLGDNTTVHKYAPVSVVGLSGVTALAAGAESIHAIALKTDGTVWAWGYNLYSQCGDNTSADRYTPVQVIGLSGVSSIVSEYGHSFAVKTDGTAWGWGSNFGAEIGDNSYSVRRTPVQVTVISGIAAMAAGYSYSHALKTDGTVWSWGSNNKGQLGDNTTTAQSTAVQVTGMSGITAVAAAYQHSVALRSDGTVWSWGDNTWGQLGDNTTTRRLTPVQAVGLAGITAIAASGGTGSYEHTMALKSDGTVWAWGQNTYGALGDNTTVRKLSAVQVVGLSGVNAISAGNVHSLALKIDGTLWAWGYNLQGGLGDNTSSNRYTAVQVTSLCSVLNLPVELLDFTAIPVKQADETYIVRSNWATASEINNDYFTVERSKDGYNFSDIGTRATQAPGGNSTVPLYYQYDDLSPFSGLSYYRLRQTDINTNFTRSYIVPVFIGPMELINIYPNPVQDEINVVIGVTENTDAAIEVFNALGQRVIDKKTILSKGTTETRINVSHLARGNYLFRIILPTKESVQKVFVK